MEWCVQLPMAWGATAFAYLDRQHGAERHVLSGRSWTVEHLDIQELLRLAGMQDGGRGEPRDLIHEGKSATTGDIGSAAAILVRTS